MKLDKEATKKAGQKVYFSPFKSQPKDKVEKKSKKVESEEPKEDEVLGYRDEE